MFSVKREGETVRRTDAKTGKKDDRYSVSQPQYTIEICMLSSPITLLFSFANSMLMSLDTVSMKRWRKEQEGESVNLTDHRTLLSKQEERERRKFGCM